MQTNFLKLNSWIKQLESTKPYRINIQNGNGFYEITFWYDTYHFSDRLSVHELEDELNCQKRILNMCSIFERNIKIKTF